MYRFACLILALGAACSGAAIPEERIIGGSQASRDQFPWQVSLRKNNNHFCGGSIANPRWIVTAAHCLSGPVNSMTVVTATLLLNSGGDRYRVSQYIKHPQYDSWSLAHDIGLVQTTINILYRWEALPVRLPNAPFNAVNAAAIVSGWGSTSFPGSGSNRLMFLNTVVISNAQCAAWSWRITNDHICTFTRDGQGTCHGDSGGPLTADGVLIGIISFGEPCARGSPDAYARVFGYVPWIRSHIGW